MAGANVKIINEVSKSIGNDGWGYHTGDSH